MKKKCTSACISQHHPAHDGLDPPEWRSLGICIALVGSKTPQPWKVEQTPSEQPIRSSVHGGGILGGNVRRTKHQEMVASHGLRLTKTPSALSSTSKSLAKKLPPELKNVVIFPTVFLFGFFVCFEFIQS